jgi:hypothetical protein
VLAQSAGIPIADMLVGVLDWCVGLQQLAVGLAPTIA